MPRGKNILEQLPEHDFYGVGKSIPFLSCYVAAEKRARISNPVKNCVLESYSKIFFTLGKVFLDSIFERLRELELQGNYIFLNYQFNKTETYSVSMPEPSLRELIVEPANFFQAEIA